MKSTKKIISVFGVALAAILLALPAASQEQSAKEAQAAKEAAALKILIEQTVSTGENLSVPTDAESAGQEMMNAGAKTRDTGNVVESDPWGKKRLKPTHFDNQKEDPGMAAITAAVGMTMATSEHKRAEFTSSVEAKTGEHLGNPNLAGLPAGGPSKALRQTLGSGHFAVTHVFYVLMMPNAPGEAPQPVKLVWRQTRGEDIAIASRSTYFVSDLEGNLLDVIERGYGYKSQPSAPRKKQDKAARDRFKAEKQSWLKTEDDAPKPRP